MDFNDRRYLSHSSVNNVTDIEFESISNDKSDFILHKDSRKFETLVIDNIPRHYCTEAKIFEFLDENIDKNYNKDIIILSELSMCDSCKGVLN